MTEVSEKFREFCEAYAGEIFQSVRAISVDGPGVSRLGYTNKELEVVEFLAHEGREMGLEVRFDKAGNCHMTVPGRDRTLPAFVSGSHADSVICGGNFDGLAGITAPLSVAKWMTINHVVPPRDFTVIVMRSEEQGCYGTLGALGRVSDTDLKRHFSADMPTLAELYTNLGIEIPPLTNGQKDPLWEKMGAFVELHIEQGPVLEQSGSERIGLVTGIVGVMVHRKITVTGRRGHAGATPFEHRADPLKAAAKWITEMEALWEENNRNGKVMTYTVGIMNTPPKSGFNIIPNEVSFSVDIRSLDKTLRDEFGEKMHELADRIAEECHVDITFDAPGYLQPCLSDPGILARLQAAANTLGIPTKAMPSGAGHDAQVVGGMGQIPMAMIFVANQNGSHCPQEAMQIQDFVLGADMIRQMALDFA